MQYIFFLIYYKENLCLYEIHYIFLYFKKYKQLKNDSPKIKYYTHNSNLLYENNELQVF